MTRRLPSRGFTLVEMLTVIVIIGILASLITAAAIRARAFVREAAIKNEISQLDMAIQNYKNEVGEYPPDFFGVHITYSDEIRRPARQRVLNHLRKLFPRYRVQGSTIDDQFDYFSDNVQANYGVDPRKFTPAAALAFWLGGLPENPVLLLPDPTVGMPSGGSNPVNVNRWTPAGFHTDPVNPFRIGTPRTRVRYEFAPEQFGELPVHTDTTNANVRNVPLYYPRGLVETTSPYVYFKALRDPLTNRWEYGVETNPGAPSSTTFRPYSYQSPLAPENRCVPYLEYVAGRGQDPMTVSEDQRLDTDNTRDFVRPWRNPEKFQIISSGLDEFFGTTNPQGIDAQGDPTVFRVTRTGGGFTEFDFDNIANFSDGRLESEIE